MKAKLSNLGFEELRQNKTENRGEVVMDLAPAYDKWLQETLAQGREETQIAIARRLLQRNMPLDEISECTELPIEVLQTLRSNASVR